MSVLILGIGSIGSHVAKVMNCLGAKVIGAVRSIPSTRLGTIERYVEMKDIDSILGDVHVIINILPNTPQTAGLFDMERFSKCRNVLFVNIGRGSVTNERDLIQALEQGFLRGAILDVFQQEPLDSSSPLWNNEKVVITPHVAGVTRAQDVVEQFGANLTSWENGQLSNCVDWEKGY